MDDNHKNKFFDYGYIGKFDQTKSNSYTYETRQKYDFDGDGIKDTVSAFYHNGFQDIGLAFTPGDKNPTGVSYTNQYYANTNPNTINNFNDVQAGLGMMNGDRPTNVYSLWYNTGRQYNGYTLDNESQFRVFTNFSADIKKHAVQAGFEFEQRNHSNYGLNPIGLWTQMRQITNSHITQLDSIPHLNELYSGSNLYYDFDRLDDGTQTQFDRSLRTALGKNSTEWIDIDSYTPENMESYGGLNMFSADDLLNLSGNSLVSYYGYDHAGKKTNKKSSLDDFFNKKDANGNYTREIGAYQPIYIAGYIQDRFAY